MIRLQVVLRSMHCKSRRDKVYIEDSYTFPGKDQSTPLYLPTLLFHQSFLILHLIFFYIGMHRYCGTIPVLIFLGLGVVAALAAATGDKKKDKEIKPSKPVDTRKDK